MAKVIQDEKTRVADYIESLSEPFKSMVIKLHSAIMSASTKLQERIKWNAPSYFYKDMDMAAFNFHDKSQVRLVMLFPRAVIQSEILEGDYDKRRLLYFTNMEDVETKSAELTRVVQEWVKLMDK